MNCCIALQPLLRACILIVAVTGSYAPAIAKRTCAAVLHSSAQMTAALVSRDTVSIKALVDPSIVYGHSNGWLENRDEMLRDLFDGTLSYKEIRLLDAPACALQHRIALIRHRVAVAIEMKGTALQMNLGVLQIWAYRHGKWVLIARQSCKIS